MTGRKENNMIRTFKKYFSAFFFLLLTFFLPPGQAQAQFNAFKDPAAAQQQSAGSDFRAVTDDIKGGKIAVGATAYVVVLFKNQGPVSIKVGKVSLYPSSTVSAEVSLNQCADAPLTTDAQCAITVAVVGKQSGAWRVEMLIDHDGRARVATASISGDVEAITVQKDEEKGDLTASSDSLDFGTSDGGSSLVKALVLNNRSAEEIMIKEIMMEVPDQSGFSYKSQCPEKLQSKETCNIVVTWLPTVRGLTQGVLAVKHSGKSGMAQSELKGVLRPNAVTNATFYPEFVPDKGLLISSSDIVDFGNGIKEEAAVTISLVNAGSSDITLKEISLAGLESGLSVLSTGCKNNDVLKPGDACPVALGWVPLRTGALLDSLQIVHTGARGILIIPVRGSAEKIKDKPAAIAVERSVEKSEAKSEAKSDSKDVAAGNLALSQVVQQGSIKKSLAAAEALTVTSLSETRGVINGPAGGLVVRDGEDVVIEGVKWTVAILPTGVILTNKKDEVVLPFDRSLKSLLSSSDAMKKAAAAATQESAASTLPPEIGDLKMINP